MSGGPGSGKIAGFPLKCNTICRLYRMFSRVHTLFQFVDRTVAEIRRRHPDEVRCGPGCCDCCHGLFDISFIEACCLASSLSETPEIFTRQAQAAQEAAAAYENVLREGSDPSRARVRCPLLGEDNLCLCHPVRPINCRTYGTPTLIDNTSHVCGLSGFDRNRSYPTIDLAPLQKSLNNYSVELVGEDFGNRRFPIAWVILRPRFFLPK